ncbi:hypothetical protein EBR43_05885 [bacterium]|nr:hypothetical protein [bacterium]
MKIDEIKKLMLDLGVVKNCHYFNRYFKMMNNYVNLSLSKKDGIGFERHHILPRAIFPEYKSEKWNIVTLPEEAQYLAHYMLYKSIRHRSCVFAFNQMQRILSDDKKLRCNLYKSMKTELRELLRTQAKNRIQ